MDAKGTGTLLLLLVTSSLLLCKGVASTPTCPLSSGCQEPLSALFDRAIHLSTSLHSLSSELLEKFEVKFSKGPKYFIPDINGCHTDAITIPGIHEEVTEIRYKDLIILASCFMRSWKEPMELFITGVKQLPNVQSDILSKAVAIKDQNHELLEVLEKIASQVNPEIKDNGMYVVWIEPEHDMPVSSVPRMRSFYNHIRCLRRDTNKLDHFFKYLKCNIIESAKC